MRRSLIVSTILHVAAVSFLLAPIHQIESDPTSINVQILPISGKINGRITLNEQKLKSGRMKNWMLGLPFGPSSKHADMSAKEDYLREYREEQESPLTAKALIYSNYFGRLANNIKYAWIKAIKPLMKNPQRRLTVVQIAISKEGVILSTKIVVECGVPVLDRAALSSIVVGSAYPNPPAGLIGNNGVGYIYWRFEINF